MKYYDTQFTCVWCSQRLFCDFIVITWRDDKTSSRETWLLRDLSVFIFISLKFTHICLNLTRLFAWMFENITYVHIYNWPQNACGYIGSVEWVLRFFFCILIFINEIDKYICVYIVTLVCCLLIPFNICIHVLWCMWMCIWLLCLAFFSSPRWFLTTFFHLNWLRRSVNCSIYFNNWSVCTYPKYIPQTVWHFIFIHKICISSWNVCLLPVDSIWPMCAYVSVLVAVAASVFFTYVLKFSDSENQYKIGVVATKLISPRNNDWISVSYIQIFLFIWIVCRALGVFKQREYIPNQFFCRNFYMCLLKHLFKKKKNCNIFLLDFFREKSLLTKKSGALLIRKRKWLC